MTAKIVILSALFISCNGLSIGTVSEQNVNKSETSIGDVFPDWVPFKNKHGDELGQFVPVTKNKVKKRLALPSNFILKAVAEPEGGDDYGIGQGGGDSEDNYENREWSDLYRPAQAINLSKKVPHTELSDIEGIVNVLTRKPANSLTDKISESRKLPTTILIDESDDEDESEEATTEVSAKVTKKQKYSEEDVDYDESDEKVKKNPVEDVSESEAKKAKILDAVDELKARHTQESRAISEKVKEEEMYKEQFERNRVVKDPVKARDKYGKSYFYKQTAPDYDEYDDKNPLLADKYKVHPIKKQTNSPTPTRTKPIIETTTHKEIKYQPVKSGKVSVFENPKLYMMYDDVDETTTVRTKGERQKFSSRYTTPSTTLPTPITENDDDDRISLIAQDSKEGEPTLFFPKKSKRRRIKTTTPATDSYNSETVNVDSKHTSVIDTTAADTRTDTTLHTAPSGTDNNVTPSGYDVTGSGSDETAPGSDVTASGSDVTASGSDVTASGSEVTAPDTGLSGHKVTRTPSPTQDLTDAVPASSDHKKEEKSGNFHNEKGGGREHHSEHDEEHEEHGKKAYEGHHEDTKIAKGHHDKENHLGKYDDHGGVDKHHSEESGHSGDHHHEEHGKKHAKYEESGKHSKGHSTKGSHDVHKKEEYNKMVEFFEEEGDSAEEEKHGGFNHEREHSEGGQFKKDNLKAGHESQSKGESGSFGNGSSRRQQGGQFKENLHAGHERHSNEASGHFGKGSSHWQQGGTTKDNLKAEPKQHPKDESVVHFGIGDLHRQQGQKYVAGNGGHDGLQNAQHFHKDGNQGLKKWMYHHGTPARTSNLVVIDRRGDRLFHGPHYYG